MHVSPYRYYLSKVGALKSDVALQPHQRDAIDRAMANNGSILLAHGVGTGKTLSSAAIFEHMRDAGRAQRALVVVPSSLRENFIEQGVNKFTTSKALKFGPKNEKGSFHIDHELPNAHYYVVSNEMFRKDPQAYIAKTKADTIIWDEAHKGRNDQSLNFAAMREARRNVKNFIALSGSPVMNHPHDIVPLVDIVTNGKHRLGTARQFDRMFVSQRVDTHGPLSALGIGTKTVEPMLKNTNYLKKELEKHVHYVPVDAVATNMPRKVVHTIPVEMSGHQKELYDYAMATVSPAIAAKVQNNIPVSTTEARNILAKIVRARQVANSVHTLDSRHNPLSGALATPKLQRALSDVNEHLKADPNNKAIIYTNLVTGGVDAAVAGLKHHGHEPGIFVGQTHQDKAERLKHIDDYLKGKKRVMVINSAGTEGLNLPGTTLHVTLDPNFNPEVTQQAEARGIRAGSPVPEVHVNRYVSVQPKMFGMIRNPFAGSTVDEWTYTVANKKTRLNNQLTDLLRRPLHTPQQ